jgi:Mce-associated membrane protein
MTEYQGQDTATDDLPHRDRATTGNGAVSGEQSGSGPATEGPAPSPLTARPSPTSRARRTAAAAASDGLRRPRPSPGPATAVLADGPATATDQDAADQAGTETPANTATPANTVDDGAGQVPEGMDGLQAPAELVSRQPLAAELGRRVPVWLVAVAAVLVLALAVLDGWLLTSQRGSGSRAEREQALSTAKTAVPLILSYDYRRFDSDVTRSRARLTGRAVEDYVKAMITTIKPTATKVHAVVQAQTDGAGVEAVSGDGDQVTVVVFGQQKVTNTTLTAPRIDLFRVRVTLDRVKGQWLVSKFDQI